MMLSHLEEYVYLVALGGFVTYYGLERYVRRTRPTPDGRTTAQGSSGSTSAPSPSTTRSSASCSFTGETPGVGSLLLFAVAMALHFIVNDYGLPRTVQCGLLRPGRWILSASVLGGAAVGALVPIGRPVLGMLFAFLSGGIVLNVIKEAPPSERDSRFLPFLAGSVAYSALLLVA